MQLPSLNLQPPRTKLIGHEQLPLASCADVFREPTEVIDAASAADFKRINPHYPGLRSPLDPALTAAFSNFIAEFATSVFGIEADAWEGQAWFSMVTLAPHKLTPIQRLPHFDGLDEDQLAIMIYLGDAGHGGTNFYRQIATGYESINQERFATFKSALENGVKESGLPPAAYPGDGAPLYEKIIEVPPAFNSMVVYRGNALHSGAIRNDLPLSTDPRKGRMTINGFFRPTR